MDLQQEKDEILRDLEKLTAKPFVKNHEKIAKGLRDLYNDIQGDFYTVVVLGEFKRGKSTLVNALLGETVLPMNVLPETATINAIMYNDEAVLNVVYRDGTSKKGEVSYDFLRQYSARMENSEAESVRYIKIGYPCELLKNRVVLVDTPGVSDLNEQRSEVTYQFVPKANAVLFVLDANAPLKKTEKEFIDERLLPLGINNIIFVINKYDAVDEDEEDDFLVEVKKRLLRAFNMDDKEAKLRDITVYPLSAKMALQGIEQGNDKLLAASGMKELKTKLNDMLFAGNMEQEKIHSYKQRLYHILQALIVELEREKSIKAANVNELEVAADVLRQMLSDKAAQESNVTGYVNLAKTKIYAMTDKSIQHFYNKLHDSVLELINDYNNQDFKVFVEKALAKVIQRNLESWVAVYGPHIDELLGMMERELARGLSKQFKQKISLKTNKGMILGKMSAFFDIEAADISGTETKVTAITAAGLVAAAVVSPFIGPLIGIWGRSKLFKNLLKKNLAEAKADVIPQVEAQLTKTIMALRTHVHKYIDQQTERIEKNSQYAYETVLEEMKKKIEVQIASKSNEGKNIQKEMEMLSENINDVKQYMIKMEV